MKIERKVIFVDENGRQIEFIPLSKIYKQKTPGFTHRVIMNGIAIDWLSDEYKPGYKASEFFFDKHKPDPIQGQQEIRQDVLCPECGTYYAPDGEICQPCRDYKDHF